MCSTSEQTCCIHTGRKWVNVKTGVKNIHIHLQIKRLQPCPCPLCVFCKYRKGNVPGRNTHQHSNSLRLQKVFPEQTLHVYSREKVDSGNLQSELRERTEGKRSYFDKSFSKDFWNGQQKCEKKTNLSRKLFTQPCERRERQAGSSRYARSRILAACSQQLPSQRTQCLKALHCCPRPRNPPDNLILHLDVQRRVRVTCGFLRAKPRGHRLQPPFK